MSNVYLNGPCIFMTPTTIHVHPVPEEDDRCDAMEVFPVLRIQFFYSLFFAIYPKLLNIFYSTLVAFIPQE